MPRPDPNLSLAALLSNHRAMNEQNRFGHIRQLAFEQERRVTVYSCLTYFFIVLACFTVFNQPFKSTFWLAVLLLACSRYSFLLLRETTRLKARLQAGITAEASVLEMLVRELPPTWSIEANIEVPSCGDVDVFVTSPNKNYFALEIKSHRTEVLFDGRNLRRGNGDFFEKDFLKQALRAAIGLRNMRKLSYINVLLVFTRATLSLPERHMRHVRVLKSDELVGFLMSHDTRTIEGMGHGSAMPLQ